MPELNDQVYKFASLDRYPLKDRLIIRLTARAFYLAIQLVGRTIRFETEGLEHLDSITATGKLPILCNWHDRIFLGLYYWKDRGLVAMASVSRDGEYIARAIQMLGSGVVRGSSSRGGTKALIAAIRAMRRGAPVAITCDGPRGPRYIAKSGAVILAKKTGNPILPFVVEPMSYWTARSWDRMQIPRPFTRAITIIGEPIYVAADAGDHEIEAKTAELQRSFDDLVERGRRWSGRAG